MNNCTISGGFRGIIVAMATLIQLAASLKTCGPPPSWSHRIEGIEWQTGVAGDVKARTTLA